MTMSRTILFSILVLELIALSTSQPNLAGDNRGSHLLQILRPSRNSFMCDPPCASNRCCLLQPEASVATCERVPLSGQGCDRDHCTRVNPSRTVAMVGRTCPCLPGNCCSGAEVNGVFDGACSGLK